MKDTIMWALVDRNTNEIITNLGFPMVFFTREAARQGKYKQVKIVKVLVRQY